MKKLAILEYSFLFNPENTWSTGYDFEVDLSVFFKTHGFNAEIVETTGNSGKRIICLSKMDKLDEMRSSSKSKMNNPADKLKELSRKPTQAELDYKSPKYNKNKGYSERKI